jgi:hypothetical protein
MFSFDFTLIIFSKNVYKFTIVKNFKTNSKEKYESFPYKNTIAVTSASFHLVRPIDNPPPNPRSTRYSDEI